MDLGIITIGIETKCGMIGYGVIHFSNLICGHHLGMIDGVTTLMVGIAGVGITMVGTIGVGDNK